jgi:hypothetical protein
MILKTYMEWIMDERFLESLGLIFCSEEVAKMYGCIPCKAAAK